MEQLVTPSSKIDLMNNYEGVTSNFSFRKRNERIDWKKLASIDIAKLSQDLDFHILQDNIVHVTFCDIERELDGTIDPNYIKLFTLAQLIIEYLLHSQEYLASIIQIIEENLKQASKSLEEEKNARMKDQKFISDLRKENKKRKLQLASQQQYFEAACKESSQCPYCPKVFVGPSYLQSHVKRRHPEFGKENQGDIYFSEQQNQKITILQKELQEIKEQMKSSEVKLTTDKSVQVCYEEQQNYVNDKEILKSIEEWKKEELTRHKEELTHARDLFKNELKELQEKHEKSENALRELQKKYAKMNSSHLESIENSLHHKTVLMEKENDEVAVLKEQLKTKLNYMESDIEKKLKKQEKEWKAKFRKMMLEHACEIEKLNINLKNTITELNAQREKSALHEKQYEEQIQDLIKCQNQEHSEKQDEDKKTDTKLKDVPPSPKENPPPPPPRTYMASRITKSPLKKRILPGTTKSHRVQLALQSSPGLLDGLRVELNGLLHDKLKAYGITTLPATPNAIRKASTASKTERKALIKKYENFGSLRDHFEQLVDETGRNKLWKQKDDNLQESQSIISKVIPSIQDKSNNTPKSSPTHVSSGSKQTPVAPITKLASQSILVKSDSKSEDQKTTPKKLTFKIPMQCSIPEREEYSSNEDFSDEENLNDFCDVNTKKLTTLGLPKTSVLPPQPAIRKSLTSDRVAKRSEESDHDGGDDDDDDETFDSFDDEFDDNERKNPIHDHYQPIYVRPPTGQLVSRLTQSIERQLQGRHSKPPAGSIDILPDIKKSLMEQVSVENIKTDEDDDSLSSLEDQLKAFESKFQIDTTIKEIQTEETTNLSKQTEMIETQEQSSRNKNKLPMSSWDSDDDISFEEIK